MLMSVTYSIPALVNSTILVSRRRDVEKAKMRDWVSFTSTKRQLYLLTLIINHKHGKFIFSGVTSRDCNIFSLKLTDYRVAR